MRNLQIVSRPERTMKSCSRFTIIELFVTMVIVVILLALVAPLFERMGAGNRVNSTARIIGSQLSLARQLAQSKSSYVALILPGDVPGLPESNKFKIHRIAYLDDDTSGGYVFSRWAEDSKWLYLPKGCTLMEADDDAGINDGTVYTKLPSDNNITEVDDVDLGGVVRGSNASDDVRAIVYSPTGKIAPAGTTRYITIGEASWTGTSWDIVNPVPPTQMHTNESCANQISIEVNGFTGGLSYLTPEKYP